MQKQPKADRHRQYRSVISPRRRQRLAVINPLLLPLLLLLPTSRGLTTFHQTYYIRLMKGIPTVTGFPSYTGIHGCPPIGPSHVAAARSWNRLDSCHFWTL